MADFYVPLATNTLSSIDSLIANAKGTEAVGNAIGNLPDAYWAGQNQAYQQRNRNLFQNGIPATGQGMAEALLRAGGAPAVPEAIALGNQQLGQDIVSRLGGGNVSGPAPYTAPIQSSTGPPSSAVPAQPQQEGSATLRQIAQARGLDVDQLAKATGINPDAPLGYNERQQIAPALRGGTTASAEEEPQLPPSTGEAPATFGQRFAALQQPGGGAMGGARPVQTVPVRPQMQPQQAPQQQIAQAQPGRPAPPSPDIQRMETQAQQYEQEAQRSSALATAAGFAGNKAGEAALTAQADRYGKAAQAIRDSILRRTEPTGAEKEAANPAVLARKRAEEIQKFDLDRSNKVYGGIQAQATQYEKDLKPYTDLGISVLSDPSVYSGIGANAVLDVNKVRAAFGDTKAAMMQEALQKLTAVNVLSQINTQKDQMQEAGSNSSRLFSAQVDQVEKASVNAGTTIAGNRFLANVQQHMGELATEVARQARDYKRVHGALDIGFDDQISKYLQKNPVFSDLERARPEVLGSPTLPPGSGKWTPQEYVAWGKTLGLRPGDTVRLRNGVYGTIPKLPGT